MKSSNLVIALLLLIVVGGYFWMNKSDNQDPAPMDDSQSTELTQLPPVEPVTVPLSAQNDSGQSGLVTFSHNADGKLVVSIQATDVDYKDPQPAHIHLGSCPNPGSVRYPLTSVVDGLSETVIDTTWEELISSKEKMAVNIHKSAAESKVYTSCGDLPIPGSDVMTTDDPTGSSY